MHHSGKVFWREVLRDKARRSSSKVEGGACLPLFVIPPNLMLHWYIPEAPRLSPTAKQESWGPHWVSHCQISKCVMTDLSREGLESELMGLPAILLCHHVRMART